MRQYGKRFQHNEHHILSAQLILATIFILPIAFKKQKGATGVLCYACKWLLVTPGCSTTFISLTHTHTHTRIQAAPGIRCYVWLPLLAVSRGYSSSCWGVRTLEDAGSVATGHRLLQLPQPGLVARWLVGSQFPIQESNFVPCIGRQILNYWTTGEVPCWSMLNCVQRK